MKRPCSTPMCPEAAEVKGRCATHQRADDKRYKQRDFARRLVYGSRAWRSARMATLERDPICVDCKAKPSTTADHVMPLRLMLERDMDPYDIDGLEGTCAACHSRRTLNEQRGTKRW